MPGNRSFGPLDNRTEACPGIIMTVDEYEAVRLIDYGGLTQEECAGQMGVSRTTAQAIYCSARSKLAESLVGGRELYIAGGSYVLCESGESGCDCGHCQRKRHKKASSGDERK